MRRRGQVTWHRGQAWGYSPVSRGTIPKNLERTQLCPSLSQDWGPSHRGSEAHLWPTQGRGWRLVLWVWSSVEACLLSFTSRTTLDVQFQPTRLLSGSQGPFRADLGLPSLQKPRPACGDHPGAIKVSSRLGRREVGTPRPAGHREVCKEQLCWTQPGDRGLGEGRRWRPPEGELGGWSPLISCLGVSNRRGLDAFQGPSSLGLGCSRGGGSETEPRLTQRHESQTAPASMGVRGDHQHRGPRSQEGGGGGR